MCSLRLILSLFFFIVTISKSVVNAQTLVCSQPNYFKQDFSAHDNGKSVDVDFDNDGNIDLAILSKNAIQFLKGNGAGAFEEAKKISYSDNCSDISFEDLNNDGHLDFIVSLKSNDLREIYHEVGLGDGTGSNWVTSTLSLGDPNFNSSVNLYRAAHNKLFDVTGDGNIDLVVALSDPKNNESKIYISKGDGLGSFQTGYNIIDIKEAASLGEDDFGEIINFDLGDINNDGSLDIICSVKEYPGIILLLNNGLGVFDTHTIISGNQYLKNYALDLGDINKDGNLDFVTVWGVDETSYYKSGKINLFLGNGDGSFVTSSIEGFGSIYNANLVDINGDNSLDLVMVGWDVYTYLGDNKGGFTLYEEISDFGIAATLIQEAPLFGIFQIDNNGIKDLNDWRGPHAFITNKIAIADFNNDDKLDIFLANKSQTLMSFNEEYEILAKDFSSVEPESNTPSMAQNTSFSSIPQYAAAYDTFYIKNTSIGELFIDSNSFTISGADSTSFFAALDFDQVILDPGSIAAFYIMFNPKEVGQLEATVNFKSSACGGATYSINVNGTGATTQMTTYNDATIISGGQTTLNGIGSIKDIDGIQVTTSDDFEGSLRADPKTGELRVSNAKPAGEYTVKVSAYSKGYFYNKPVIGTTKGFAGGVKSGLKGATKGAAKGFAKAHASWDIFLPGFKMNYITEFQLTVSPPLCSNGEFELTEEVKIEGKPLFLAITDFNNDGKQDFVTTYENSILNFDGLNNATVKYGTGSSFYTQPLQTGLILGPDPRGVITGDFNGDGIDDIQAVNSDFAGTLICREAEQLDPLNYIFHPPYPNLFQSLPIGVYARDLVKTDVNKDGIQDIIVLCRGTQFGGSTASFYKGNGWGGYRIYTTKLLPAGIGFLANETTSIVAGDFDKDGVSDIAGVSDGSGEGMVYKNELYDDIFTASTFQRNQILPMLPGNDAKDIEKINYNKDDNIDLITVAKGDNIITIYAGLNDGEFADPVSVSFKTASGPTAIATGDFNGDDYIDIAFACAGADSVGILLRDTFNTFIKPYYFKVGDQPNDLKIGDFNADGILDIAVACYGDSTVSILTGVSPVAVSASFEGNGQTISNPSTIISASNNTLFPISKVGETGVQEFRFQNQKGNVSVFEDNFSITGSNADLFEFVEFRTQLESGEVVPVELPIQLKDYEYLAFDIAFKSNTALIANATIELDIPNCAVPVNFKFDIEAEALIPVSLGDYSSAEFQVGQNYTVSPAQPPFNATYILGKVNNGFDGEIVVNKTSGEVILTAGNKVGSFQAEIVATGKYGFLDTATFEILINPTPECLESFTKEGDYATGNFPKSIALGDINNDGFVDLVSADSINGQVSIKTGKAAGFNNGNFYVTGAGSNDVEFADINGDGNLDLIVVNSEAKTLTTRVGEGNGNFGVVSHYGVSAKPLNVVSADMNNDGFIDVVISYEATDTFTILLSDTSGNLTASAPISTLSAIHNFDLADFNQDGYLDLLVNYEGNSLNSYLGSENFNFTENGDFTYLTTQNEFIVSDITNDSLVDLIIYNYASKKLITKANLGEGSFTDVASILCPIAPSKIIAGHFNQDSYIDLLVYNSTLGTLITYNGDGVGNFSESISTTIESGIKDFRLADVNKDDFIDVLAVNANTQNITYFKGLGSTIKLSGLGENIESNNTSFSQNNNTDYSSASLGTNVANEFTVTNEGNGDLIIYSIDLEGVNSNLFSLSTHSFPDTILPGNSSSFEVTFSPLVIGDYSAAISIINSDCSTPDFIMNLEGSGANFTMANYSATTIRNVANLQIDPSNSTSNIAGGIAYSKKNFNGTITVGENGVLNISNAWPAGDHLIFVKIFDEAGTMDSTSFVLTVEDPLCSYGEFKKVELKEKIESFGDFNNDGIVDYIVAGDYPDYGFSIVLVNENGSFDESISFSSATNLYNIEVIDFNSDGFLDIVSVAGSVNNTLIAHINDGTGDLSETKTIGLSQDYCKQYNFKDINNDGLIDILCSYNNDQVKTFIGEGNYNFSTPIESTLHDGAEDFKLSDFNGDGNLDIVGVGYPYSSKSISIVFGDGEGKFSGRRQYDYGDISFDKVELADVNNDNIVDLVIVNDWASEVSPIDSGSIHVMIGVGNGTFSKQSSINFDFQIKDVKVVDFDGDGNSDIITTENIGPPNYDNSISFLKGYGNGNFNKEYSETAKEFDGDFQVVDFNQDGRYDLYFPSNQMPLLNTANLSLAVNKSLNNLIVIPSANATISEGKNTDFGDVCLGSTKKHVFTFVNDLTNLTFNQKSDLNNVMSISGVNSNDFEITGFEFPFNLKKDSTFEFTVEFTPSSIGEHEAIINLNYTSCETENLTYKIGGSGINFGSAVAGSYSNVEISVGKTITVSPDQVGSNFDYIGIKPDSRFDGVLSIDSATGDLRIINPIKPGSFNTDLLYVKGCDTAVSSLTITVITGACFSNSFTSQKIGEAYGSYGQLKTTDFNNDGILDIVIVDSDNTDVFFGDANGGFTLNQQLPEHKGWSLEPQDYNNDGFIDLAISNYISNHVSIYLGSQDGNLYLNSTYTSSLLNSAREAGTSIQTMFAHDFNNDGKLDLFQELNFSNDYSVDGVYFLILIGDGEGNFKDQIKVNIDPKFNKISILDANSDGNLDILHTSSANPTAPLTILYGNGDATFSSPITFGSFYPVYDMKVTNLNNDSYDDIILYTANVNTATIPYQYTYYVNKLMGDSEGKFTSIGRTLMADQKNCISMLTADINIDGYNDIIFPLIGSDSILIEYGDGLGGVVATDYIVDTLSGFKRALLGDFNNDGILDIVERGYDELAIYNGSPASIEVLGNGNAILSNNITTSLKDSTDFGIVCSGQNPVHEFEIKNVGKGSLTIQSNGISLTGNNSTDFNLLGASSTFVIAQDSVKSFSVEFIGVTQGIKTAQVEISSNDCSNPTFTFSIRAEVGDTVAPELSCEIGDSVFMIDEGECFATIEAALVVADNCDNDITITKDTLENNEYPVGIHTINFIATDDYINTTTCSVNFEIFEFIQPTITCPGNVKISCEASIDSSETGVPLFFDNCDLSTSLAYYDINVTGDCPNSFDIHRIWKTTDVSNNKATCTQIISLVDTTAPIANIPSDITLRLGDDYLPIFAGEATGDDNCSANVLISYEDSILTNVCPEGSEILRTWFVTDSCSNTTSGLQKIHLSDTILPEVTSCPKDTVVLYLSDVPLPDSSIVSATDNCGEVSIVYLAETNNGADRIENEPYIITHTYSAVDESGNSSICEHNITVKNYDMESALINSGDFIIFPVPANQEITVFWSSSFNDDDIEIIISDIVGEVLFVKKVESQPLINRANINISNLAQAAYLVTIKTKDEKITQKMVKVKN